MVGKLFSRLRKPHEHAPRFIYSQVTKTFLRLIDTASLNDAIDYTLYNIVLEEAQSYFAGDKTLDEVVDMIQRRVSLYVAERM